MVEGSDSPVDQRDRNQERQRDRDNRRDRYAISHLTRVLWNQFSVCWESRMNFRLRDPECSSLSSEVN